MPAYSRILLPRDSQPQEAAEIARDNSLTRSLALLINPGAGFYDAAGQRSVTPNGVSIAASSAGLAFDAASNASAGASFAKSRMATSDGAGTGDFSILVVGNPVASATREMLFSITNGTTEFYFAVNATVGLVASSGVVSPQTNAGGAVGVAQSGGADGRMHAWLYVREAVAADFGYLYRDGVLVNSGALGSPNAAMWSSTSADNVGGWSGANWGTSQSVVLVAGWNRVVSPSEAELLTRSVDSPYQLFAPRSIWVPVSASGGGTATDLTIQDATHGHTADGLTITVASTLAIADATHAHAADSLALTTSTVLVIADATHAHTADSLTLSVSGATDLAIQDALHGHTADSLALTLGYVDLAIADALHGHAADNITLGGLYTDLELILKILSNRQ